MKNKKLFIILFPIFLNLIPILIGVILVVSIKNRLNLFEIVTSTFGVIYIIIFTIRANHNLKVERNNQIENKEEPDLEKIKYYKMGQRMFLYSGLAQLLLGAIYYLIIRFSYGG